jgi:hypothetical protein
VGGVVTAERAWSAYQNLKRNVQGPTLDVSSFEYSVKLLCQALRTSDAKGRIQELKMMFGRSQNDLSLSESNDQSMTEGLAVSYLALGQAHAILKETKESIDACKLAVVFAVNSKKALKNAESFSSKHAGPAFYIHRFSRTFRLTFFLPSYRETRMETKQWRRGSPFRFKYCVSAPSFIRD